MLQQIIEQYKANIAYINKEELYKWRAVKWFQDHWDIDTANFPAMLSSSLEKSMNLLSAGMYFARKMIELFAQMEPETVRSMFRVLFDESITLQQRIDSFTKNAELLLEKEKARRDPGKAIGHYQNMQAISVYLTFKYPEKYYIYKAGIYTAAAKKLGLVDLAKKPVEKLLAFNKLCDDIHTQILHDVQLLQMSKESLTADCYPDEHYRLLAQNIAFLASNIDNQTQATPVPEDDYWPSLDEYDPGISMEQWMELLRDKTVCPDSTLLVLAMYMAQGGEATCAHLAAVYGKTPYYYNGVGTSFATAVHKKTNCPLFEDEGKLRYFPVVFRGRHVKEGDLYSWKLRSELHMALQQIGLPEVKPPNGGSTMNIGLNTILYGPPGTGKTYHTMLYAVAIIEKKNIEAIAEEAVLDYNNVASRYRAYKERGFIEFTTFHQSFGYEEFIEGIKPVLVEAEDEVAELAYQVVPGTFKRFCERAVLPVSVASGDDLGLNNNPTIWKVSLEGTYDNPTRRECLDNGHIRIGWDDYGPEITEQTDYSTHGGKNVLYAFLQDMQIGDIVLSCYNASEIDAVGVITGEAEWRSEYPHYKRLRKVRWLVKDIRHNIVEMNNGRKMTLSTVYRLRVSLADVMEILAATQKDKPKNDVRPGNYVFIIDEINRGNISKIFGELITLIEPTKRLGQPEAMTVRLPYQEKPFGVPDNVYLLGTMNTADRSIALLDTALRRRFQFVEMQPNPDVLNDVYVKGCSISAMLEKINRRIEVLYDREHTIGHAYFMPLKQNPTVETLAGIFENCIMPLLAEYFFEDFQKIRLVLGDNQKLEENQQFVLASPVDYEHLFGKSGRDLLDDEDGIKYQWNKDALLNIEAYMGI